MRRSSSGTLVRELDVLYQVGTIGGLTDHELLGHFTAADGEAAQRAFEAIVHRHGPMVLGACRRSLCDEHMAEDAFQATFLVLALKAETIRQRSSLGPWLHGVASRVSRRARMFAHRLREQPLAEECLALSAAVGSDHDDAELRSVLDEEIDRLPSAYRRAIVLCYLEGKTQEDAARELGWTKGTVSGRLARAKDLLRGRLRRRGFAPSPMVFGALLAQESAETAVSTSLVIGVVRQAVGVVLRRAEAAAASGAVVALARGALCTMFFNKLRLGVTALLSLGIIAAGVVLLSRSAAVTKDEPKSSSNGARSGRASADQPTTPKASPDRIVITGRVHGPDGKPVPGARVAVVARPQTRTDDPREWVKSDVLASTKADTDGHFRLDVPRSTPPSDRDYLGLVVGGTGWALATKVLDWSTSSDEGTITLQPGRILRGRFIDLQGQPASGVVVRVTRYLTQPYVAVGEAPPWPGPVTTDDQGRFTVRGLGPGDTITLEAGGDRYARQSFRIDLVDETWNREQTFALSPAQVIEVHVTRADDGKPMTGAWVDVLPLPRRPQPGPMLETSARTGEQGVARIIPGLGESFWITVRPPAGEPYLNQRLDINWPKGAVRQSVELKLKRGVSVHGKITEEASGKPVAGAFVGYLQTRRNNNFYRGREGAPSEALTGREGDFQIVVPAGPGYLLVRAPTPDYLHLTTNNLELGTGGLPNWLIYPDALAHVDLKPEETSHEVTMRLRRGMTVAGRVVGPDGKPIAKAIAFGRTYVPYVGLRTFFAGSFNGILPEIKVRDGRFEIPGCDPEKPSMFYIFDGEHQLGATVEICGKSAENGPVIVQLKKCGAARVRYKDSQEKPVAGYQPAAYRQVQLVLVITPGTDSPERDKTMADVAYQVNLDPERMRALRTGAEGGVTMESLIPGATYRYRGHDFTVEAGKTIDLPDVTIARE